ncbi:MAG TPA: hypothetical protein DCQ04_16515 [Actinobacteria bacterium]|nr:hypothetical protein [Actinomycetota bacterium]
MSSGKPFTVIEAQLDRSTLELLDRLVELHLNALPGKRQEFFWVRSSSLAGDHDQLAWLGGEQRGEHVPFTGHDLQTLHDTGFFPRTNGGRNAFRVNQDAIRFYRWRVQRRGPAPLEQAEGAVRSLLDDPTKLQRRHPEAARLLNDAYAHLWGEMTDDIIVNIGGSLRSALSALTADLVGHTTNPEQVENALRPWLTEPGRLPPRHGEAMAAHLGLVVKCSQRLNHLYDERSKGQPTPTWDEVRRTAFAVALLCYELDRLTPQT